MSELIRIKDKATGHHYTVAENVLSDVDPQTYSKSRESALLPDGSIRPPKFNLSPAPERSSETTEADVADDDKEN